MSVVYILQGSIKVSTLQTQGQLYMQTQTVHKRPCCTTLYLHLMFYSIKLQLIMLISAGRPLNVHNFTPEHCLRTKHIYLLHPLFSTFLQHVVWPFLKCKCMRNRSGFHISPSTWPINCISSFQFAM